MNKDLIENYISRLESSLRDPSDFSKVFDELRIDPAVLQPELVAIANKFVGPMASGTPKSKALDRILARHTNLLAFKLKQKAVGGRSAA